MKIVYNRFLPVLLAVFMLAGVSIISGCKWGSWDLFGGDPINDGSGGNRGSSGNDDDGTDPDTNFPPAVFSATRSGTKINEPIQLYSSFEDGSEINELTGVINQDSIGDDFKVSPDGTLVAYLSNENNGNGQFELFVVPVDGGDSTRISPSLSNNANADVVEFKWSPDGSRIAYLADIAIDDRFELYTNLAEGGSNLKVSDTLPAAGEEVTSFEWAPNSQRLAYIADERIPGQFELFSTLPTQTDSDLVSRIFLDNNGNVLEFAWSPDSSRIAYLSNQRLGTQNDLYTSTPTGGQNTYVSNGADVVDFAWAPAEPSEQLAYSTLDQIFTVLQDDGDGDSNTQITPALVGTIAEFAWAPDNSRIAYRADQNEAGIVELFTVTPDGDDDRKVSGDLTDAGSVTDFAWAPYSDFIAYRADQDFDDTFELYVTSPDGSSGDTKVSGPMAGEVEPDFAWSPELDPPEPDSVRVAYRANQRTADAIELFSSTPDGQTNDRVCGRLQDGGLVESFAWAPDNSGIGYIADQVSLGFFELFASLPDGRRNSKLSGTIASSGDVLVFEWVFDRVP